MYFGKFICWLYLGWTVGGTEVKIRGEREREREAWGMVAFNIFLNVHNKTTYFEHVIIFIESHLFTRKCMLYI